MAVLNPYLTFDGDARAAMELYAAVLGGELTATTFGEAGMAGEGRPAEHVMHSQLVTGLGFTLMASDGTPGAQNGNISISGDEVDAIRGYYDALAEAGEVTMELSRAPWGDEFGEVRDRYGVRWLFNISPAPAA